MVMTKLTGLRLKQGFIQAFLLFIGVVAVAGGGLLTPVQAQDMSTDSLPDKRRALPDTAKKPFFIKKVATSAFNKYFNDTSDPEKPKFLAYPTLAFAPETSWEFGLSGLMLFYARRDTTNRLSEISAFLFTTLNRQYGAWFEHFLYGHQDNWFFLGRLRFQRFPLKYFGIGPQAQQANKQTINADYILIRERVLRKVKPNLFVGLETDFQQVGRIQIDPGNGVLPKPLGAEGSRNIGLGIGVVYDTRHNPLNVRKGWFGELAYLNYNPAWGSNYKFTSLSMDGRWYKPVGSNQVWASQVFGQFMQGNVPFNQLALMGGENLMRGYYLGRFRDKTYLAAQTEYRFLPFGFSKRLGGVVFASTGAVAPTPNHFSLKHLQPAGGVGLRYLVFPKKDIFVRLDVAFTREGANFYIYTGEAF